MGPSVGEGTNPFIRSASDAGEEGAAVVDEEAATRALGWPFLALFGQI